MSQKPSIGRIVHFVAAENTPPSAHHAAIVTHVFSDTCVNLDVSPTGLLDYDDGAGLKTSVTFDETGEKAYSWHWPERVE